MYADFGDSHSAVRPSYESTEPAGLTDNCSAVCRLCSSKSWALQAPVRLSNESTF